MNESSPIEPQIDAKYEADYSTLQKILGILKELGLTPIDHPVNIVQDNWDRNSPFPIALDGGHGIRVNRDRFDGGLTVSFTNGFEESKDPTRVRVTAALRERNIEVV